MQGITWRAGFTLAILAMLAFLGPRVLPEGNGNGALSPATPPAAAGTSSAGYRAGQTLLNADLTGTPLPARRAVPSALPAPRATAAPALPVKSSARGEAPIWR